MSEIAEIDTPTGDCPLELEQIQLEIRLFTKLSTKYQIPDAKIVVSGTLSRIELSELVNESLSLESRVPFDFLINGAYLRGSLGVHINDHGILSERTLDIEYIIAMDELETSDMTLPTDVWISGIAVHGIQFFTASMNGMVACHDLESGKEMYSAQYGVLPLTGIFVTSQGIVVTTSRDGTIRFSDITLEVFQSGKMEGPNGFQFLSVCPFDETLAVTGTVNGDIHLWNVPTSAGERKNKKRTSPSEAVPRNTLDSNSVSSITGIVWLSLHRIVVGSIDGSLQVIDPLSNHALPSIQTNRPISSLTCLSGARIITGHADGRVIFWNLRTDGTASIEATNACRSHTRMVSTMLARPGDEFLIASGSLDGTVKLLDSRAAQFAVQSISVPANQHVLSLTWVNSNRLLSGASDGIVRSHVIQNIE